MDIVGVSKWARPRRRPSSWLPVALSLSIAAGAFGQQDTYRPTPRFEGAKVPDPPRQADPWTAPETKLPRFLVNSTALLFEQGMADPRGCEYREVEVGDGSLVATRGFVLPERPGDAGRFVVGWDGVVQPAFSVGVAADLDADIRALAGSMKGNRREAEAKGKAGVGAALGFTGLQSRWFAPSGAKPIGPASVEIASALKVCLLLRLGRADLAEDLFAAGTTWTREARPLDLTDYRISYLTLAREWANRAYNRAVDAHGRGDDAIALDSARRVAAFARAAEAKLEELGFSRAQPNVMGVQAGSYFPNLRQVGDLLADQERRAKEPPRGPVPGPTALPEARVAALIRDLDLVGGSGFMMNGMASPTGSETERELVLEGDVAVERLLAALESDNRLTRTVSFPSSRHGGDDRSVSYVYQTVHSALTGILKTRVIPGATGSPWVNDPAARKREAEAIRAYWVKVRAVPIPERYYRILADDASTKAQWLDAAEALAQPADVQGRGGSYSIPYRVGGKVPVPRGEPLRDRKGPSVTDLMARRAESLDPPRGPVENFGVYEANRMANFLARWDPKGALPTLKARVARCASIVKASEGKTSRPDGLEAAIARMTLLRQDAGDPGALDDYAGWVRTVTPSGFSFFPVEMFEPTWRNADHPTIASAAEALFDDPKSPWVPLFRPRERGWNGDAFKAGLVTSPMLGVDPFRKLVLAGLADRRETGSVTTDAEGKVVVKIDEGTTSFPAMLKDDPLRPASPSTMPLRLADLYCSTLQGIGGSPRCELYWPEAKRDEAIARCEAFLRQYGPGFRYRQAAKSLYESAPFYPQHPKAILTFDPLDRPATPEDVRAGRAIFSLDAAEARIWPLPTFPMKARWTTQEIPDDDPVLRSVRSTNGRTRSQVEILQGGTVWQAEEASEGGRWRRYYGFMGRFALARVPAEEVEFPASWNTGWSPVSAELDGRLIPPGGSDDGSRIVSKEVTLGEPLPIEVWLRNRRGVASEAPADWARVEGGLSLRDGLTIRLSRLPETPSTAKGRGTAPPPAREIPAREVRRHRDGEGPRSLAPAAATRALRFDLRDAFDIGAAGRYRLEVMSEFLATADGKMGQISAYFTVIDPVRGPSGPGGGR